MTVVLARLAIDDDPARRALYWRGPASPDASGAALVLAPGAHVDLGTWFNTAPVAWWRSLLGPAEFAVEVVGSGLLAVTSLDGAGRLNTERVPLAGSRRISVDKDARWCWLDLHGQEGGGRLESVQWSAALPTPSADRRITAVVPTFRREQDALAQVEALLDVALVDVVGRVLLVDQARTVRSAPGADQVLTAAGDRLILLEQDNLGGSGGYARGMLESLAFPQDPVLLLDDDATVDPEGLRRMLTLSLTAVRPTILGSALFSAEQPTVLSALAERVHPGAFRWGPSDGLRRPANLTSLRPPAWRFADPSAPTDYAGWWAALLPAGAVADLGLPVPYFLKWDDAEYGLRARRAGYDVRTLPGTGCWHPTWGAKGTIASWAAWPLHRNRLATAAAYGAGRGVVADSLAHQVKHVLSLQYDTADLWDAALAQVSLGPEWLNSALWNTRQRAEALLAEHPAAVPIAISPALSLESPGRRTVAGLIAAIPAALLGLLRPARLRAVAVVPAKEFRWPDGLGRDAVLLDGSDRVLRRDPARARAALVRTVRLHLDAARSWGRLRSRYAAALPESRTEKRWRSALHPVDEPSARGQLSADRLAVDNP